jgi:exopolyphosphatase/guanosine-5'-triphosphate,3'-diphosphate pyrophosphatase
MLSNGTSPVAVIDIGSNSGRVAVLHRDCAGHLRLVTGSRAPLRLVRDVDEQQNLTEKSMARTLEAVRDFHAIAAGSGATRIVAVATAAMRDARNGGVLIDRIRRELRIQVDIIDGQAEGRYGFAGAVRGLPAASGLLFDLGGGSMQLSQFNNRALDRVISLPLGALRLSELFLASDPPRPKELRRLRQHVEKQFATANVPALGSHERLLGTGGTLRNLAKIDNHARRYPIAQLHGYVLSLKRLHRIAGDLTARRQHDRDGISGLSAGRADSIAGGAVTIEALMEHVGADEVLVSGQGVREGIALELLKMKMATIRDVKEAAVASLVGRFDGWNAEAAARRRSLATTLLSTLEPRPAPGIADALAHGAHVLGIGRNLDFVARHELVADILLATEMNGFTHEELASVSALVRLTGDRHADTTAYEPLIADADRPHLQRAAVLLALADAIEARCPRGRAIAVTCTVGRRVTVSVPQLLSWHPSDLGHRFERVFGKSLVVVPGA